MIFKTSEVIKPLETCVCCGGKNLEFVIDLTNQPLANSYLKDQTESELSFPLQLNYCKDCTHLQLSHVVHPDYLFKNYLYVSGTSKTLREYFDWFAEFVSNAITIPETNNILDIACNDGSQLNSFKKLGYNTYGIDPAENLFELSSKEHTVICDYLTKENVKSFGVKFDAIVAQNVFAHNDYPEQFLLACKEVLSDKGYMFIQTSQANMVMNNEFDTIYHEHISFFSAKSLCTLAKRCGFNVIDIEKTSVHGTSFVFVLSKTEEDRSDRLLLREDELNSDIIKEYANKCHKVVDDLKQTIEKFRLEGYKIIGYGAAAKGNTLLNFGEIDLDYIVDDNPLKHKLYTPGRNILIKSPDALLEEKETIVIIPLAWNFFDEIKKNVSLRNNNVIFVRYFPSINIE
jgi:2-polyprenyl-3-methyl-5-hydroxy-6-metoxy-1,4-benzoquinol methylase